MNQLQVWFATALGVFLAIFALQNMAPVEITVAVWTFESRRIVVIGLSFVVGLAVGWIAGGHGRRSGDRGRKSAAP